MNLSLLVGAFTMVLLATWQLNLSLFSSITHPKSAKEHFLWIRSGFLNQKFSHWLHSYKAELCRHADNSYLEAVFWNESQNSALVGGSGFSLTISTSETKWVILRAKINLTSESGHQKLAICCKANTELWSPALSFSTAQSPYHSHLNHSDFPPKCTLHWSSPAKDSGLLSSILRTLLEKIQFGTSKETFDLSLSQMIAPYSPWATAALGAFQREMI